jgi:hypothetical protein
MIYLAHQGDFLETILLMCRWTCSKIHPWRLEKWDFWYVFLDSVGIVEFELIIWTLLTGLIGVLSTDGVLLGNTWWWYGGAWEKWILFIIATFIHFCKCISSIWVKNKKYCMVITCCALLDLFSTSGWIISVRGCRLRMVNPTGLSGVDGQVP